MSRVNLGRVTMMPKGVWDSSSTYKRLDIVTNNGVSYIALQDVPANTVVTNTTYWMAVTPEISIGDVSTLNPSQNASASITSTSTGKLNLNLGLPRGLSGNETIDDDAGLGDIDVVWSANKTKSETNSKQNAITKTVSGSIVSFDDAIEAPVTNAVVNIEPVQDLHGFDAPWPAGGGKNLLNVTAATQTLNGVTFTVNRDSSGNLINITVNGTATEQCIFNLGTYSLTAGTYILNGCASGGGTTTYYIDWRTDDELQRVDKGSGSTISTEGQTGKMSRIIIASGVTLSNVVFKPMIRLTTETDDTFEPYSNICPISGFDSMKVTRTGKNLLNINDIIAGIYSDNNFNIVSSSVFRSFKFLAEAGTYIISFPIPVNIVRKIVDDIYRKDIANNVSNYIINISKKSWFGISWRNAESNTAEWNDELIIQLEQGNTPTTITSYQGSTYSITFPSEAGTVYGGSLDASTGKLTVHMGIVTTAWKKHNSYNHIFYQPKVDTNNKRSAKIICNTLPNIIAPSLSEFDTFDYGIRTSDLIYVVNKDCTTADEFNSWSNAIGLQIIYELETPLTYQLTPQQVTTLLGQNNIWADTGDITVDYQYNINKTLAEKLDNTKITGNIEPISTATQNYTAGSLAIVQNQLIRVTQNIATGGAITIGNNAETIDLETLIAEKAEKILVAKLPFLSSAELYNNTADFHNAMPRGKDITAYFTDGSLWDRINGANNYSLFEDLYVGDYLTAGGQQYMIVDFDYYIRAGNPDITEHHLVMMPKGNMNIPAGTQLHGSSETLELINTANAGVTVSSQETAINKKWNATMEAPNTGNTKGGYKFSRMRQVIMRAADTIVINAFGATHAKPISVWYPNPADATADGPASNGTWFMNNDWTAPDRKSICDLLNETQIYGQQVWGRGSDYTNSGYEVGMDKWQFSFFRYNRNCANIRASWWFRSVSSTSSAAYINTGGFGSSNSTSNVYGVRPRFLLVG